MGKVHMDCKHGEVTAMPS